VDELRKRADELWIIEKQPQKGDLPERLLELSPGLTILMGPSTPMSPVLFEYGVDMLCSLSISFNISSVSETLITAILLYFSYIHFLDKTSHSIFAS